MKIAFVSQPLDRIIPPFQSSIGIWTHEVARRLARFCGVTVYTRGDRAQRDAEWDGGIRHRCVSVRPDDRLLRLLRRLSGLYGSRRPLFASGLYYLGYILRVANDLRDRPCDVVHVQNFSQFVPVIRAFNPDARIVLHMHCEWLTQLDRRMIERRLRQADLVVGCSDYITRKIRQRFPRFADRCQTVCNGVDVDRFSGKNGHPRGGDARRLLFVGRISPEKGVHVLLDAFQKVVARCPQARLEVVGPQGAAPIEFIVGLADDPRVSGLASFYRGDYFSLLQSRLSSDAMGRVSFKGQVAHSRLSDHYRNADVLINPSLSEAFGMSLVEAMATGIPAVATRVGGVPEVVEDGKTGLLVEPGDASALAGAILRLLDDEGLRRSMGEAARRRAVERYSWEAVADRLWRHYKTICGHDERFMPKRPGASVF
ncbi:glycosyltransferase family 4 protein [bacterium]|nr:glycosyltransferase family 4 protein [bacterium]